ncbi:sigma-54 dependent transcriptional regulator [Geomonas paludis]|uniref:Sigma-54 dependent transcriptional regulator n=1 Tax=Geomonas paludis TaxID=2740185 RepID=A0A6V8MX36_9BACT|nr:sigma-54 dependent transcriptional regulator [Geomonas paludis]UPU34906.1 sigma-54 dependent transcriptional regulator [Geomonas paludis]GFO64640.1 sigma-54-dependent Fis family transcriptional regulator [Geomonas paludis]
MKSNEATPLPVVVVDDDQDMLQIYRALLQGHGVGPVLTFEDGDGLLPYLRRHEAALVVLDLALPTVTGRDLLPRLVEEFPHLPVLIITGMAEVGQAVSCMRAGACDYLLKPIDNGLFLAAIDRALGPCEDEHRLRWRRMPFPDIVTEDPQMLRLMKRAQAVSHSGQPVLITGETGVGKELFAEAVHRCSGKKGALVTVNVAGVDDAVFSDTLFGHRKGAFTSAQENREGLIRKAAGGTLFLDEIGDLSEGSQVKLLRLIQEHEYLPLGSDAAAKTDAGIVVATNRDLKLLLEQGKLREDLYYRLSCHRLHIPPLRERQGDIPLLLEHFVTLASRQMGKKRPWYPSELPRLLQQYHFPGNVRELQAMVYDAVALHEKGPLTLAAFRSNMSIPSGKGLTVEGHEVVTVIFNGFPSIKEAQSHLISEALRMSNGNQGEAASLLGISRQALNNRLRRKSA